MNQFYKQPLVLQWVEAIILVCIGFYPFILMIQAGSAQPLFYSLFLVFIPLMQFSSTPIFKLTGIYTYYSPMLLGYMANNQQIDLHSGTGFDYLFVMRKFKLGTESRNRILAYHLGGLLKIIKMLEDEKIPNTVQIIGTSYFFNERTIHKLGFELKEASLFYRINLFVNIIDLVWMYSVSQGRFAVPKIWNAKKANISGGKLLESKDLLESLYHNINSKLKVQN